MDLDELIEAIATARQHDYSAAFLVEGKSSVAHEVISYDDRACDYCGATGWIVVDAYGKEATCPACIDGYEGDPVATVQAVGDDYRFEVDISDLSLLVADVCPCGDIKCQWAAF
tara:strand:- start:7993 stop:8334 length:342 start_codon:yes stop_codon:yes gene_type:complete